MYACVCVCVCVCFDACVRIYLPVRISALVVMISVRNSLSLSPSLITFVCSICLTFHWRALFSVFHTIHSSAMIPFAKVYRVFVPFALCAACVDGIVGVVGARPDQLYICDNVQFW